MSFSIFKNNPSGTTQIDTEEAYNIWNLLRARYSSMETYQMLTNFVHDKELSILLKSHLDNFKHQVKILENRAETFKIKSPERPPKTVKVSMQINEMTDAFIFRKIFNDLLAELYSISRSVISSITNDNLRGAFRKFLASHINDYERLILLGKVKGWNDISPSYKTTKPVKEEKISVAETNHIWNHVAFRYHQMQQTQLFVGFVHDKEFKLMMTTGIKSLDKQVKILEKKAFDFEIPLPTMPPATQNTSIDPESLEDKFMYRMILLGTNSAVDLHTRAIIECTRNDSVRKTFNDFLKVELDIQDNYIKYGKFKGWTPLPPMYFQIT